MTDGTALLDRPALDRRIDASLADGRTPVLLGGCGSGRTSALRRLARAHAPHVQYLDLLGAATTPERSLRAIALASPFHALRQWAADPAAHARRASPFASPREAFDALLRGFDDAAAEVPGALFLIDDLLELRTFENFPGLRNVVPDTVAHLAQSPARFVVTSRFTARAHRVLRDAPARFEVIHVPALDVSEVEAMARARDGHADWARRVAPDVLAFSAGRVSYAAALIATMAATAGHAHDDAHAAMIELWAPDGRLTALARFSYEFRLHRARGYGALKAILGILAEDEPLTLTDIAQRLSRTPGSTKDYLSWLEDVDLLQVQRKRYSFQDPLVRLYVRLYAASQPPTASAVADAVRVPPQTTVLAAATERSESIVSEPKPPPASAPDPAPVPAPAKSGLIEID